MENLSVDGRIMQWTLREIRREVVSWRHLVQDRNQWRAPLSIVMNLLVPQKVENFLT
jgi:hypothetical protein